MEETETLAYVLRCARSRAEKAKDKVIQIYSIAYLISEFKSLKREDPPEFCNYDVIHTMVLFANQLNEVTNDLIAIISDLNRVNEQEPLAHAE